jgi:hypothetical protein
MGAFMATCHWQDSSQVAGFFGDSCAHDLQVLIVFQDIQNVPCG